MYQEAITKLKGVKKMGGLTFAFEWHFSWVHLIHPTARTYTVKYLINAWSTKNTKLVSKLETCWSYDNRWKMKIMKNDYKITACTCGAVERLRLASLSGRQNRPERRNHHHPFFANKATTNCSKNSSFTPNTNPPSYKPQLMAIVAETKNNNLKKVSNNQE